MTNAEKIRSMSDEDLAALLDKILDAGREWFDAWSCNRCQAENAGQCPHPEDGACPRIGGEVLAWLKAE